jgi:ubiquinol-cytochrome c reductase cytochrome b subunit
MSTVFKRLGDWFDNRTGARHLAHEALYENVPGGSRWIYVTGSMLVFAFVTQAVTGLFLWMSYSAGSQNAWESVYYITNVMQGGWLLRGVHHYMAQAMVVLLPLHLLQVVLCRAYVAPREINYWLGLVLMLIVMALGLTGYLLPWDQKGYWATKVATELMSLPPGGAYIQKLVVGGGDYGHATLTRFFAMHAGLLPALLVGVLVLHVAMFRKHGLTAESSEKRPDEPFWPRQVFKDAAACLALLAAVIAISVWRRVELGPPAEPTQSYGAARPEWYFLFLFQLLKKFHSEFFGAIVLPGLVMLFLFALPLISKIRWGHVVNCTVILILVIGAGYLTYEAVDHDNYHLTHPEPPAGEQAKELWAERVEAAKKFHEAREQAELDYERTVELVEYYGIPREGAAEGLVAKDPEIQGPRFFKRNCASCHSYLDEKGNGIRGPEPQQVDGELAANGAPNLYGIGTPDWFARFLDPKEIVSDEVFGLSNKRNGEMVDFAKTLVDLGDDDKQRLKNIALALSAEAALVRRRDEDKANASKIEAGIAALQAAVGENGQNCLECHTFRDEGTTDYAPDLTGMGSYEWLYGMISNPEHGRFYGNVGNDRMPAFAADPDDPSRNLLSHDEIDMLVRWLRGDDRVLERDVRDEGREG